MRDGVMHLGYDTSGIELLDFYSERQSHPTPDRGRAATCG